MEVIDYKNSIISISNSILKYFDLKPYHDILKELDKILEEKKYQNIVLLLCDGMGSINLKNNLEKNTFLRKNHLKDITSVFPPTTTAATTSILSGKTPSEHNWYGWDMYFKDTNETISLFLNKRKEDMEKPKLDVLNRKYMQYESIIDLINKKTSYKSYYLSPFSKENTCYNLNDVCSNIIKLSNQDGKKFIYAYIENPDKLMHKYGLKSEFVKDEFNYINEKIEELANKIENTLIIVTADHGLIDTKYINLKKDIPDIFNMLERTTSIEARACGIKLKDNISHEEFEKLFNMYLKDNFTLLTTKEVLDLKLFGNKKSKYLIDTIGDYLIVATGIYSINYDDNSPIFKANHAGFTNDELLVPLIIIDCK